MEPTTTDSTLEQRPKQMWIRLESNPDIIHENGVDQAWNFHDIYGFDEPSMIPESTVAIIFLYPVNDISKQFRQEEKEKLISQGQDMSDNVIYFKQTIGNACGPGLFHDIVTKAEKMSIKDRAELLETNEELATVHKNAALSGQTKPRTDNSDRHYYVCFTKIDGQLYELDGSKAFPIYHGPCEDFVQATFKVLLEYIERDSKSYDFSAMALSKSN
ncbi:hypothetical protein INT45_007923 [Circinella minor]|uniref:ubiquitinyl hydrolase 1 n=1 Tax=Circinella minor TaxID=1195481 RepID=A0A8H7VQ54_9FUNG|nr:hypothetical protein INT45_007923 [Circinella minor]